MVTIPEIRQLITYHGGNHEDLAKSIFNLINSRKTKKPEKSAKKSKEYVYLEKCAKMCKYPVDIEMKFISVPAGFEEIARDDLTVSHLIYLHGFFIQSCIPDSVPDKDVFNPDFNEKKSVEFTDLDITLPARGETWIYMSERWYIKKVDESFHVSFLGSLKADSKKSIEDIRNLVYKNELVKSP